MNTGRYIYGRLSGNAGVTALVGTRIFPMIAPQEGAFPLVVYSVDNRPMDGNMKDRAAYHDTATVTLTIWADVKFGQDAYTSLDAIDSAIREAIDFQTGTVSGVTCEGCRYVGGVDIYSEDRLLLGRNTTYSLIIRN